MICRLFQRRLCNRIEKNEHATENHETACVCGFYSPYSARKKDCYTTLRTDLSTKERPLCFQPLSKAAEGMIPSASPVFRMSIAMSIRHSLSDCRLSEAAETMLYAGFHLFHSKSGSGFPQHFSRHHPLGASGFPIPFQYGCGSISRTTASTMLSFSAACTVFRFPVSLFPGSGSTISGISPDSHISIDTCYPDEKRPCNADNALHMGHTQAVSQLSV